jgi:N-methylhydantoinase B/oxoprolinase/acetone carboxylase alpha subunit
MIDFSGTSAQDTGNFNAPPSIAQAAVLYVFRTLVDDTIPLNEGCLKPIDIVMPEGCLLNPREGAAVVAGHRRPRRPLRRHRRGCRHPTTARPPAGTSDCG